VHGASKLPVLLSNAAGTRHLLKCIEYDESLQIHHGSNSRAERHSAQIFERLCECVILRAFGYAHEMRGEWIHKKPRHSGQTGTVQREAYTQ